MYTHYNMNQMTLELSTQYSPEPGHIVWFINDFVEELEIHYAYIFGRPREYDFSMLLKLLLYSYSRGVFTSRPMAIFAKENLPARWLTQERFPSHDTICRFRRSDELGEILTNSFSYFTAFLKEQGLIDDKLFIDGTKLLADANKYSFVWKKNTIRYQEMNRKQLISLINELNDYYQRAFIPEDTQLTLEDLEEIITILEVRLQDLDAEINADPKLSPNPKKQERRFLKSRAAKIRKRAAKASGYQTQQSIMGDRNSYSKTDHDATFMRMKEDPMRNGQLKPGYNLQVATRNQYFLAYSLFPNPTDTRTLKPFMKTHEALFKSTNIISLDAGYGSQANYEFLEDEFPNLTALIPYSTYRKEKTKKWLQDERKVMNWDYFEADDYYIDPLGVRFNFNAYRTRRDYYGYERQFKEYKAEKYDDMHQVIPEALTPKGYVRKINVNLELEYFKAQQRQLLADKNYRKIYSLRKIDVEPAFGFLKASLGFTRFHLRGMDKVHNEMGLALMACNLRKLSLNLGNRKRLRYFYSYLQIKYLSLFLLFLQPLSLLLWIIFY